MTTEHRHPRCATSCYVTPRGAPLLDVTQDQRREIAAQDQRIAEPEAVPTEQTTGGQS